MPITKITGTGIKGLTFEQELGKRTLFVGPNGSGKTSRSIALQLAVLGYVPGAGKQQGATFDAFAPQGAKELWAGVEMDGKLIERGFTRSKSGTTSKAFRLKKLKAKEDAFNAALGRASIEVMDLSSFVDASDAKKIDWLFQLYSDVDVAAIEERIENQAQTVKDLDRRVKEQTGAVAQLQAAKSSLELPAGTLAEKQAEIVEREQQLAQAREELSKAKVEQAREEERQKAAEEAKKLSTPQASSRAVTAEERQTLAQPPQKSPTEQPDLFSQPEPRGVPHSRPAPPPPCATFAPRDCDDQAAPLRRVLQTLESAGCSHCAARLVTLKELRALEKEAAHV
ncbi:AAA family ATPase [Oceanidesulfovibrio marinus]|uniref:Rad50/SbcC-type AAA domain-containing protein n=1 Tax=Oceanidesulfovibrio marinus TaxID=370038 RepID=A0A6P1ZJ80_9BACT|nr:AAA family ATPase [Oceanidesulfovibrio marinus]TVM35643.1 hypothetical protein DQK91_02965 [Oceanidesulfovibrio marinus]